MLRFLNARLPLPSSSDLKNHVVGFASRKMLEETADSEAESKKENYRRRKIKTEKLMKPPELEDTQKVKRVDSKVHIKLPPMTQSTVI